MGIAINEQLVADREKLQQMKEDFEDIDDGIKQSKKLLGQFWRRYPLLPTSTFHSPCASSFRSPHALFLP